ncbi:MAG: hypothetical protein Q8S19_03565, partial [Bacillota bacterium]|nr:hypothetical protein [Bacillota bacterium]
GLPIQDFVRPDGIEEATICQSSSLLARAECPTELRRTELFMPGTAPTEGCSVHEPKPLFPWPWNWFRNDPTPPAGQTTKPPPPMGQTAKPSVPRTDPQTPAPQLIETPVDSNTNVEEIDPVVTEPTPAENTVPDKPRDYEEQETP